ncbi:MAG TPA: outer membrane protein transport protein [Chitinophagaceae bacterium]|nr:outer membrane protein transport protein [Chitinophagaceae bacterium]
MKPFLLVTILVCISFCAYTQTPDDALRNSWFIPGGSARIMGIGGASGSLGGDITSNNVNPAGTGIIRTKEVVLSPGFMFNSNSADFRGTSASASKSAFSYGATGIVLGGPVQYSNTFNSFTFSLSFNQLASYNNHVHYKGYNNLSSYSEQFLEELARDHASPNAALGNYIFGSSLAYYTYLIDTTTSNGNLIYFGLPNPATGLNQEYDEVTSGSYNEVSLTFAGGMNDKLFLGLSLNVPIVTYRRDVTFTESDATTNTNNNFAYSTFTQSYRSNGVGLNFKVGLIYKPQDNFRIGLAIHSPSFIWYKDKIRAAMTTSTEGYLNNPDYPNGTVSASSDDFNSGNPGEADYQLQTPVKVIASATYLFSPVPDPKKQRGFISADVEYTGYGSSKFLPYNSANASGDNYFSTLNSATSDYLKGNVNVRVGGELKFDPLAFRLGAGYYGSPYRDTQLKADRISLAGGIGYRNHGMYIDLAYVETLTKDVNFPYRLNDKPNTYATLNNNRGNVILTVGFKI